MTNTNHPRSETTPAGAGARFLASLPARLRPTQRDIDRLAPKAELLLSNGVTAGELLRRLTAGIDSAHSPAGALLRRLENLSLPKGVPAPERPPWCGECDEKTRLLEKPDTGLPYRCPQCNPRAVSA